MPSDSLDRSMSSLSLASTDSQPEDDWDHSLIHDLESSSLAAPLELSTADSTAVSQLSGSTPRNSVVFPSEETPSRARRYISNQETGLHSRSASVDVLDGCVKKRTLSDLLKLHSENGSNGDISVEEAKRIADVLGQWINASSSPYEGEDDFFTRHSQDDINLNASTASRRVSSAAPDCAGRPRGKSESVNSNVGSRPSSSLDVIVS